MIYINFNTSIIYDMIYDMQIIQLGYDIIYEMNFNMIYTIWNKWFKSLLYHKFKLFMIYYIIIYDYQIKKRFLTFCICYGVIHTFESARRRYLFIIIFEFGLGHLDKIQITDLDNQ